MQGRDPILLRYRGSLWMHSLVVCPVATAIVFFARAIGSFGSGDNLSTVLAHSCLIVAVGYACFTPFAASFMRGFGHRIPLWLCAAIGCVVGAVPAALLAPILSWVAGVMPSQLGVGETRADLLEDIALRYPRIFLSFALLGGLLWFVLNFRWWQLTLEGGPMGKQATSGDPAGFTEMTSAAPTGGEEAVVNRLPFDKRGPVLALSAEQHYVRVHTEKGDDLVLTRFGDAMAHFDQEQGIRIHRSHWVRKSAVEDVADRDGKLVLRLNNGIELPVSRSYSGAIKELFMVK